MSDDVLAVVTIASVLGWSFFCAWLGSRGERMAWSRALAAQTKIVNNLWTEAYLRDQAARAETAPPSDDEQPTDEPPAEE
jgi:hypothetical protein